MSRYKVYGEGVWIVTMTPQNFDKVAEHYPAIAEREATTRYLIKEQEEIPNLIEAMEATLTQIKKENEGVVKRGRKPGSEISQVVSELHELKDKELVKGEWNSYTLKPLTEARRNKSSVVDLLPIDFSVKKEPKEEKQTSSQPTVTPSEFMYEKIPGFIDRFWDQMSEGGQIRAGNYVITRVEEDK